MSTEEKSKIQSSMIGTDDKDHRVYYFCYGSNLLTKRMHVNNKSALKYGNGHLNGYELTFSGYSQLWRGSTANITPQTNSVVWGVVWSLTESDLPKLDAQEIGYYALFVHVTVDNGNGNHTVKCRTYIQRDEYALMTGMVNEGIDSIDSVQRPSVAYKTVIIKGAMEQCLPSDYIENVIKAYPDNGITNCGLPQVLEDD